MIIRLGRYAFKIYWLGICRMVDPGVYWAEIDETRVRRGLD